MNSFDIKVVGRVQGVGFRYYTKRKADDLGLVGTVKNVQDGSVHITVVGEAPILLEFITWCHTGPATALVESLIYEAIPPQDFEGFEILR